MPNQQQENIEQPDIAGSDVEDFDTVSAFADLFESNGESQPNDADAQNLETGEEPEPQTEDEPQDTDPKPDEPAPAQAPENPATEDELTQLRQKNAELAQYYRSTEGRISGFQKKVNGLEQELNETRQKLQAQEQAKNLLSEEDVARFKGDYKDIATYLEHERATMRAELQAEFDRRFSQQMQPLNQRFEQLDTMQHQQVLNRELDTLRQAHPDFESIQKDSAFWGWVNQQPPAVQAIVQSTSAADNIALLDLYKSQRPARPNPQQQLAEHAAPPRAGAKPIAPEDTDITDTAAYFEQITNS